MASHGTEISKEDDSQYDVEVIVEKSWRLLPPTSMPVIHCLPHDSDLNCCNDNALPGLVDVRLIQWYSGAFIVACLSMTGVIGDSDVWHHLGQR